MYRGFRNTFRARNLLLIFFVATLAGLEVVTWPPIEPLSQDAKQLIYMAFVIVTGGGALIKAQFP